MFIWTISDVIGVTVFAIVVIVAVLLVVAEWVRERRSNKQKGKK